MLEYSKGEVRPRDLTRLIESLHKIRVNSEKIYNGTPCWEWDHRRTHDQYGYLHLFGEHYTHRAFYRYFIGNIPDGYEVDHLCRNRPCCNPLHTEAVPVLVNRKRRDEAATSCRRGHPFNEADTLVVASKTGGTFRKCRICSRERVKAFYARNPGYNKRFKTAL